MYTARWSLFLPTACLAMSCATTGVREPVTTAATIDALALCDVVFLGEEHDNTAGHALQLELLTGLHQRRPRLVLSMEMFERDVQEHLDAYLAGKATEAEFLAASRPWPNYARHYRPLVEYAKEHGLAVVAANVPRDLARKVRQQGLDAVQGDPHAARSTTAPRDAYWRDFCESMKDHVGSETSEAVTKMYESQCLKDDTMAESIVAHTGFDGDQRPLVVHVCGKFHSDHGRGTVARVRQRDPSLRIGIVSTESVPVPRIDAASGVADFVIVVAEEPPKPKATETPTTESPDAEAVEEDPDARPALGFMPDYQSEGGVGIASVRDGGPAAEAGLMDGDLIVEIDGQPIDDVESYMEVLGNLTVGQTVEVVVERAKEEKRFKVKVGRRAH